MSISSSQRDEFNKGGVVLLNMPENKFGPVKLFFTQLDILFSDNMVFQGWKYIYQGVQNLFLDVFI